MRPAVFIEVTFTGPEREDASGLERKRVAVVARYARITTTDDAQQARIELENGIEALLKAYGEATGLTARITAGEAVMGGVDIEVML